MGKNGAGGVERGVGYEGVVHGQRPDRMADAGRMGEGESTVRVMPGCLQTSTQGMWTRSAPGARGLLLLQC